MSLFSRNSVKSVESILSNLTNTVVELEQHAVAQLDAAHLKKAEAAAAELAHKAYLAEHALAKTVANNIKGLLGA